MKIFRYLLITLSGILILFLIFLGIATLADYRPDEEEVLFRSQNVEPLTDTSFSALIWNIGYGGLDAGMDFFYDGGKQVRPEEDQVNENIDRIIDELMQFSETDFILLQEVDKKSKRSYRNDIYQKVAASFPGYYSAFGMNYKSFFVPLPVQAPMGKVVSGLQSLSSSTPLSVTRYQFPGNYSWPTRLFMLDRCFLVYRYPLPGQKELLIVNTHNSAYDDGSLRTRQMEYLKDFLIGEYRSGNYIVVGGDWNQTPDGFIPEFEADLFDTLDLTYIPAGYPEEEWTWAYDASIPTNRRLKTPYMQGETPTTLIDCYLLSPNIALDSIRGIGMGFEHSDHHPVFITFSLKPLIK
jgi:endonuclease/exonuclease/phosphatase family metal-dependent hydrolase